MRHCCSLLVLFSWTSAAACSGETLPQDSSNAVASGDPSDTNALPTAGPAPSGTGPAPGMPVTTPPSGTGTTAAPLPTPAPLTTPSARPEPAPVPSNTAPSVATGGTPNSPEPTPSSEPASGGVPNVPVVGGAPPMGTGQAGMGNEPPVGGSPPDPGMAGAGTGGTGNGAGGSTSPPAEVDCNAMMPSSGAQQHSGQGTGGDGNLAWEIWSNTMQGELTTYDVPAFSAIWNEAGGYLGRLGFEWGAFGDTPEPYESHGTITAEFVANKSGTAGGYSYIGMYGWTNEPCVEWYVVDDSYNNMPFNPGMTTNMGEVDIDDGTYIMYTRPTTGTGGSRCSGVNEWIQYYSMRTTARQCGKISLTQHFDAWKELGMDMGVLLEAKILVEVGGGTGRVDLPIANVTTTQ